MSRIISPGLTETAPQNIPAGARGVALSFERIAWRDDGIEVRNGADSEREVIRIAITLVNGRRRERHQIGASGGVKPDTSEGGVISPGNITYMRLRFGSKFEGGTFVISINCLATVGIETVDLLEWFF